MGRLPNALNEHSTLVSGFPSLRELPLVLWEADRAQFVHVNRNDSAHEHTHMPVVEDLNLLVLLKLEIVQMVVVNIDLLAQVNELALLDLD